MEKQDPQPGIVEWLRRPIPWRPALQIGDAGYRGMPKPVLRALIESAQRPSTG